MRPASVAGTGTAKTAQPVEGRSPARTARKAGDAQTPSDKPEQPRSGNGLTDTLAVGPTSSQGAQ